MENAYKTSLTLGRAAQALMEDKYSRIRSLSESVNITLGFKDITFAEAAIRQLYAIIEAVGTHQNSGLEASVDLVGENATLTLLAVMKEVKAYSPAMYALFSKKYDFKVDGAEHLIKP